MNLSPHRTHFRPLFCLPLLCLLVLPSALYAQRSKAASAKASPGGYDIASDLSLQGTVVSYTENSKTAPIGAHVVLQTSAGNVDVHLGDARLLHLAKLNLAPGMSVRVVGQSQTIGQSNVFLARLVQVGAQVVALRSDHGLPLAPAGIRGNKALAANVSATQQGGVR
ncbi:MAG TPA: hypothetical protein VLC94_05885 [Candidatus Acidoferrum sp.]|nr:hypothetical protein [Candidatus Acidoferrum sp.]